jgi:hypothetical protein
VAGSDTTDDELLLALTGIELAAAAVHDAVIGAGLLDAASASLVASLAEHHRSHASAYAEALADGGAIEPDPAAIEVLFGPMFGAPDAATLLRGALAVEVAMAATAVDACTRLDDHVVAALAARVAAVEARHQAVLGAALGDAATPTTATEGSLLDA